MNMEMVGALFGLFSGEQDVQAYLPLLMSAVREVTQELREDADVRDARLCYLAAAIANLRYAQIHAAQEKAMATFAGTLRRVTDETEQMQFARELVSAYRGLCAELVKDRCFLFFGVGGCGNALPV